MMHDGGPVAAQHGYTVEKWAARMTSWRGTGVSPPVNLLYVANTRRTVDKTLSALYGLRRRIGDTGIDALPDISWLRLVDFIERPGQQILYDDAQLLGRSTNA